MSDTVQSLEELGAAIGQGGEVRANDVIGCLASGRFRLLFIGQQGVELELAVDLVEVAQLIVGGEAHILRAAVDGDHRAPLGIGARAAEGLPGGIPHIDCDAGQGRLGDLVVSPEVAGGLIAPIAGGSVLGELQVSLDDKPIAQQPLVALRDIPKGGLWRQLVDEIRMMIAQ